MKRILFLLLLTTFVFSKSYKVEKWDDSKTYTGQEIVYYNHDFYIAIIKFKKNVTGTPDSSTNWVKVEKHHTPGEYNEDSLYVIGDAVLYNGSIFIAGHNTDYVAPSTDEDHEAWVEATGAIASLPPHPGEEGNATINGIDSNGDGIRDDVEIAIVMMAPDNADIRGTMMAGAKASLIDLETYTSNSAPTLEDMKIGITVYSFALRHMMMETMNNTPAYKIALIFDTVEKLVLNTPERRSISSKISKLFNGKSIPNAGYIEYRSEAQQIYQTIYAQEQER